MFALLLLVLFGDCGSSHAIKSSRFHTHRGKKGEKGRTNSSGHREAEQNES